MHAPIEPNRAAGDSPDESLFPTRAQVLRRQYLEYLLYARAAGGLLAAGVLVGFEFFAPESELLLAVAVALCVTLSSALIVFWLRQGGRARLAGHLTLVTDLVLISAATIVLGGIGSGVPGLYLWVPIASGLLFQRRAVPAYTVACLAVAAVVLVPAATGVWHFMPIPSGQIELLVRGSVLIFTATFVALAAFLLVRAQEEMLAEVEHLNQQLEQRVGAATLDLAEALRETKELHDGLNASYEKLNRLQRFRDEMVHMIVHDLKSPLSNVVTTLEIMRMVLEAQGLPADADETHLIDNAALSADQMSRLITNLLDIHRLEEGKLTVQLAPTDLSVTLRERCQQIGARLTQKHLSLNAAIPERLPPARADRVLLGRVIDNLLDNAIKYTPQGGCISVSASPNDGQLVVSVANSGPGIPEVDRQRVFEKFEQLSSDRRSASGVGLGLAFCKMAMHAQGGRIWLDATQNDEGATFCVALERYTDVGNRESADGDQES